MPINFSKNMPTTVENSGDRNANFVLGRKFYLKVAKPDIIDYTKCSNTSSITCGKPIKQNDASLRTQQLRLKNIGAGSINLKDSRDTLNYFGNNNDINYINNRLSKSRAGGAIAPRKSNYYKI